MELDDLAEVLERLTKVDPSDLADPESIVALHRHLATMDAVATQATAAFDAAGDWAPDGARTASAWVTAKCRVKKERGQTPGPPGPGAAVPARDHPGLGRR